MSLIARCPACATLFRVVPDQLKISDGWVRCGQCAEVFDAHLTLQETTPAAVAPEPVPAPAQDPPIQAAADAVTSDPVEPVMAPDPLPEHPLQADTPSTEYEHAPADEVSDRAEPVLAPGPLPGDEAAAAPDTAVTPAEPPADDPTIVGSETDKPELQDMAFVRQARRRAFWRHPRVRTSMGVGAALLGLLLAGQVVFQHRDRLASQVPALQPALAALCGALTCRLGPPRHIESITIESSAFTRVRADAFRLSLTLSNQADLALAMPALELTLTDLQDQPVLRRVLQPADLGPETASSLAARTEWTTTLTLAIAPGANPARIVGYRVLAFYP